MWGERLVWGLLVLLRRKKVADEFKDFLMDAMGLAALGTIADVVPLKMENRILAKTWPLTPCSIQKTPVSWRKRSGGT